MIKIVHCADIHIGASFGRLPSALASLRAKEQRDTFSDLITYCKENNADALCICGDLFDSPKPLKKDADFVRKELSSLSPVPVYIICGNHDYFSSDSPFAQKDFFSDNVLIFPSFDYSFEINDKDAVIYGKSYNAAVTEPSFTEIRPDKDKINILCLHGDLNISGSYNPINKQTLSDLPINYVALGHIHNGETFEIGNLKCAYPGIPEAVGFDDDGCTGFICAEITKGETHLSRISSSRRNYHNITYNTNGETTEAITEKIRKTLHKNDLYKITITGETANDINTEIIRNELNEDCFYIEIYDETSLCYDFDSIENEESLRGEFLREVRKLTSSEEEFILCGKAGLDALSGKIPSPEVEQ